MARITTAIRERVESILSSGVETVNADSVNTETASTTILDVGDESRTVANTVDSSNTAQRIFPDNKSSDQIIFVSGQEFISEVIIAKSSGTDLGINKLIVGAEDIDINGNGRHTVEIDGDGYLTVRNTGTENRRYITFHAVQFRQGNA